MNSSVCSSCNDPCFGKRDGKSCCRDCLKFSDHTWQSALEESQRIRETSHGESLLAKAISRGHAIDTDLSNRNFQQSVLRSRQLPRWLVELGKTFNTCDDLDYYLFMRRYTV